MQGIRHIWTDEEIKRVLYLRDECGWEFEQIAEDLNLGADTCKQKYYYASNLSTERPTEHISKAARPLEHLLEDRERRQRARDQQNLTSQFFGDPPPGYSALDRRQAVAERSAVVTLPRDEAGLVP
jgi:DNA-directed RNA polymerase specialized sigma24 family protein